MAESKTDIFQSLPNFLKLLTPFGPEKTEAIRFATLNTMATKKYTHYLRQLNEIVAQVKIVLRDEKKILDDNAFDNFTKEIWWKKELPDIYKQYYVKYNIGTLALSYNKSFLGKLLNTFLNTYVLDKLIGRPESMPEQQILLFKTVISTYFSKPDILWPILINMDYMFRKSPPEGSNFTNHVINIFKSTIIGAGPFIIKVFQQLDSVSKHIEFGSIKVHDLTKDVTSNLPPLTNKEFEFILNKLERVENSIFSEEQFAELKARMTTKALSSGSIGETHCTYITSMPSGIVLNQKDTKCLGDYKVAHPKDPENDAMIPVVLKLQKPLYLFYMMCEIQLLLSATWKQLSHAKNPAMTKQARQLMLFLIREFASEFDFTEEAKFTQEAHSIYNKPLEGLHSVQYLAHNTSPFPYLLLEVAGGVPLKNVLSKYEQYNANPDTKQKMILVLTNQISKLLTTWVENLFWGKGGYFHADLHEGNILVPTLNSLQIDVETNKLPDIWLIDFGSSGRLDVKIQQELLHALLYSGNFKNINLIPEVAKILNAVPDKLPVLKKSNSFFNVLKNALAKEESEEIKPINLARFVRTFSKLSIDQKKALNIELSKDKYLKLHEENLRYMKGFVRILWNLCDIPDKNYTLLNNAANKMIDYSRNLEFGVLFLRYVELAPDVGICTSNETLMFGRAIAFVVQTINELVATCNNPNICPPFDITKIIEGLIRKDPKKLKQVATSQLNLSANASNGQIAITVSKALVKGVNNAVGNVIGSTVGSVGNAVRWFLPG